MKWILSVALMFVSVGLWPQASHGIGMKRMLATKRANLQVSMGAPDYYYSMDSYTITFMNYGRGSTGFLTTNFIEPGFVYFITLDTCDGNNLGPYQTCSITVQYSHPGSYPQVGWISLTSTRASIDYAVRSCNPMVC